MRKLITPIMLLLAAGCTHTTNRPATQTASDAVAAADSDPVIVRVVSRHNVVTIRSSPRGPLYSVADEQGSTLVAKVTLEELRTEHPDIYRQVAPALASHQQVVGDARVARF
ncbi:MAG TPA: hypothetical protein VF669_18330 [Tepidisphaeraceae bacterium]